MTCKILKLLHLLVYIIITAQLLFYVVVLADSLKQISLDNFIELRKVVDAIMVSRFRIVYYVGLLLSMALAIYYMKHPSSLMFMVYTIAFLCMLVDVVIALQGNGPINTLINGYTPGDTSQNWEALRMQWLKLVTVRGWFIIMGMVSVGIGLIWAKKLQ